jgi:tight adherence protein C
MDMMNLAIMGGVALVLILYSLWPSRSETAEKVRRRTAGLEPAKDTSAADKARGKAHRFDVLEKAAPFLSRPVMPKNAAEQTTLKAKLATAGFRRESASTIFLASKTVGGIACGLLAGTYAAASEREFQQMLYIIIFGLGAGFMLPNVWLGMVVKKRSEAIRNGLPDGLDLMVVGVEAGLGLDAAMQRVGDEMATAHPSLAEEMQIATVETQMGVTRAESLCKMADRTGVAEMRALVAVIVQAEKLGTSIAKALRNQADSLRTKRRQAAEERAQKTAVKLLIPLILFIFPAIFVVLAGPAALHLMKTFSGGGLKH